MSFTFVTKKTVRIEINSPVKSKSTVKVTNLTRLKKIKTKTAGRNPPAAF